MSWTLVHSRFAILGERQPDAGAPGVEESSGEEEPIPRFSSIFARDAYLASRQKARAGAVEGQTMGSGGSSDPGELEEREGDLSEGRRGAQGPRGSGEARDSRSAGGSRDPQASRFARGGKANAKSEKRRAAAAFEAKISNKQGEPLDDLSSELGNRIRELLASLGSRPGEDAPVAEPSPALLAAVSSRTGRDTSLPAPWISGGFADRVLGIFTDLGRHAAFPRGSCARFGRSLSSLLVSGPRATFDPAEPAIVEPEAADLCMLPLSRMLTAPGALGRDIADLTQEVFRRPKEAEGLASAAMRQLLLQTDLGASGKSKNALYSWDPANRFAAQLVLEARPDVYVSALANALGEHYGWLPHFLPPRLVSTVCWLLAQPALQRRRVPVEVLSRGTGAKSRNQGARPDPARALLTSRRVQQPHQPQQAGAGEVPGEAPAEAPAETASAAGRIDWRASATPLAFAIGVPDTPKAVELAAGWVRSYRSSWDAYCVLLRSSCFDLRSLVDYERGWRPQDYTDAFYAMYHYEALAALLYSIAASGDWEVFSVAEELLETLLPFHGFLRARTVTFSSAGAAETRRNASELTLQLPRMLLGILPGSTCFSGGRSREVDFAGLQERYFALMQLFSLSYTDIRDPDVVTSPGTVVGREGLLSTVQFYQASAQEYRAAFPQAEGRERSKRSAAQRRAPAVDYRGMAGAVCSSKIVGADLVLFSELHSLLGEDYDQLDAELRQLKIPGYAGGKGGLRDAEAGKTEKTERSAGRRVPAALAASASRPDGPQEKPRRGKPCGAGKRRFSQQAEEQLAKAALPARAELRHPAPAASAASLSGLFLSFLFITCILLSLATIVCALSLFFGFQPATDVTRLFVGFHDRSAREFGRALRAGARKFRGE